ncbi:MAG TPA: DMT family transporter [Alphaproteobacteria bacterium]|jgi:drug/metabolite transporter (DMT)-like permease
MNFRETVAPLLERYWRSVPANYRGAFWMMLSAISFIIVQSLTKTLGHKFDSFQIAFFRALFGGLAVLPFLLSRGFAAYRTPNLPFHLGRGLFGAAAIYLMVFAVIHMPIADATVIGFTRTLFMIFLAVLFLGEVVRWRRWTATLAGFAGVVVMMRPGDETFQLAALAALGASLCFASAHVCIKKCTARADHPMTVQTYYWTTASLLTLVPGLLVWVQPSAWEFGVLVLMGVMSGLAQTCIVYSLRVGEATFVHPFDYTRLIWAALAGWILFAEPLGAMTALGALLIIGSNLYIVRREAFERRRADRSGKKA